MPLGDFYQEYGPGQRRRSSAAPDPDKPRPRRPRRPREPRPRLSMATLRRLLVGTLLVLLLVATLLPYAVSLAFAGRAMPGVSIQGIAVDDASREAIETMLAARYADMERAPLTLAYHTQTWQPPLADLGASFDHAATTRAALRIGRRGHPLRRLHELRLLLTRGIDVAPVLVIDWEQMQRALLRVAADGVETPPRDAALSVAYGKIIGTPSADGRQMLVDATAYDVVRALQTMTPQTVTVRTRTLPPLINDSALAQARAQAEVFLGSTLVLTREANMWVWDAETIAGLLRVDMVGHNLLVDIDQQALTDQVASLAQRVDSGSVEPRLRFAGGALAVVEPGREGWRLQQEAAAQVIDTVLRQRSATSRTVVLPVDRIYPVIDETRLDTLGIVELVAEGRSSFAGSAPYRITNIKAGAARLDGVLIAPDEEFSFNTQLGEVNAENGFVEGYAVVGNRTQLEWGGGVCQDSTTVFRAAFWAGLPITERHAHPFYISWYDRFAYGPAGDGPGMDATIYTGVSDLKFVNDTGHWLLMQTVVDEAAQVFTVQVYGTRPDRRVEADGPYISNEVSAPATPIYVDDPTQPAGTFYQSDVARSGRDIVVYRTVFNSAGEMLRRDSFFTRFKPWPNVFVRGTGP